MGGWRDGQTMREEWADPSSYSEKRGMRNWSEVNDSDWILNDESGMGMLCCNLIWMETRKILKIPFGSVEISLKPISYVLKLREIFTENDKSPEIYNLMW